MSGRRSEVPITDSLHKTIAKSGTPLLTLEQETGVKRASIMQRIFPAFDDMEVSSSKLGVTIQPSLQDGVNVRLDERIIIGEFSVEERNDYDPANWHGDSLSDVRIMALGYCST